MRTSPFSARAILQVVLVAILALTMPFPSTQAGRLAATTGPAQPVQVGLVTDPGTLQDMSFNWLAYQGLLRAEGELGVVGTVYTSTDPGDFEPNLQQCVADGNDLCIAVSFLLQDATWNVAQAYTGTLFAIVDVQYDTYLPNLRGMIFAEEEGAYLAGTLAGLMTDSDILGEIGGMPIPPVDRFLYGFRNGAQCANPTATAIISYTDDFANPDLGAQVAQAQMAQGADTIFAAAGPTGYGAVLTATQSGAWGIGVDTDFYVSVFLSGTVPGSDRLLTSALKRIDNVVFFTINDVVNNQFTSGTVRYNLAMDGVGIAPFHDTDPLIPQTVKDQLEVVRQGIVSGTVDPWYTCRVFNRYVDAATGSDDSDCRDPNDPCKSIGYAVTQAGDSDSILVAQGTYTENVWLDRRVFLEGGYSGPPDWTRDLPLYPTTIHSADATVFGDWDGNDIYDPAVISSTGILKMWYTGSGIQKPSRIGYVESPDGVHWTRPITHAVLSEGSPGDWDESGVGQPMVIEQGGLYQMWYFGNSAQVSQVGYATSTNGVDWAKYAGNPVLTVGAPGEWDEGSVGGPAVVFDGTTYHLWYHGATGVGDFRIGYATSPDGTHWTKYGSNPVFTPGAPGDWDSGFVFFPAIVTDSGYLSMWYSTQYKPEGVGIGYVTSTNGITWTRTLTAPVLPVGGPGEWDQNYVQTPAVLEHQGAYHMWYTGYAADWAPPPHFGYATSPDGISWTKSISNPVFAPGEPGHWGQPVVTFAEGSSGAMLDGFIVTGGDSDTGAGLRITGEPKPGPGAPGFEYEASECLAPSPALTPTEAITVYVEGNDVVMSHTNAPYNCCAVMVVDFEDQRPLLKLIERETYPSGGPCYCLCPYNLGARISDLEPGEYQVEVWDEPNNRLILSVPVTIPGGVAGRGAIEAVDNILVQNCVITANHAYNWGGGVWVTNADATISGTLIADNWTTLSGGGGMEVSNDWGPAHLEMRSSMLSGNTAAQNGGGLHVWSATAALDQVSFYGNTAGQAGGGLDVEQGSGVQVSASGFYSNTAFWGGGMQIQQGSAATLDACRVEDNAALDAGGGIRLLDESLLTMTNGLVAGNSTPRADGFAGVEFAWPSSGGLLVNVTVADNELSSGVGGIRHADPSWPLTVVNAIIYGNAGEQLRCEGDAGCDVTYSDVEGGWAGTGNMDADPLFAGGGDYHLQDASPCIDAGTGAGAPDHDIEGDLRPFGYGVDMGADEWLGSLSVEVGPASQSGGGAAGTTVIYTLTVTNAGNYTDTFTLAAAGVWTPTLSTGTAGPLGPGEVLTFTLDVAIPPGATPGSADIAVVTATSGWDAAVWATAQLTTTAVQMQFTVYLPMVFK